MVIKTLLMLDLGSFYDSKVNKIIYIKLYKKFYSNINQIVIMRRKFTSFSAFRRFSKHSQMLECISENTPFI